MKRFILALIILLVPILSLVQVTSSNETALAGTLAGWDYRKAITINHTDDGNVSDYQMMLTLNKSVGNDSTGVIYLNNHALNWPTDIYFTKSDGTTGVDFWRESNTSTQGVWWIEADSILNGSTWTGYIYYGDLDAADESSITDTMIIGDDFRRADSASIGGLWSEIDATKSSISSQTLVLTGATECYQSLSMPAGSSVMMEAQWKASNLAAGKFNAWYLQASDTKAAGLSLGGVANKFLYLGSAVWVDSGTGDISADTFYKGHLIYDVSDSKYDYGKDRAAPFATNNVGYANVHATQITVAGVASSTTTYQWVYVRKYTANEPTWAASGAEESLCAAYLTTSSGSGGNVSTPGEGTYSEACNASVSIVATADACYRFLNWTGNTTDIANTSAASTTIAMGTTNKTATANFVINTSTITYTAGTGGTINGTSPQTGNCGSNTTSVTAVASACYSFVNWSDSSTSATRNDTWTSTNQTFTANFAAVSYGAPTSIVCLSGSDNIILSWTRGTSTNATYIRWKVGSYPTNISDGNLIGLNYGGTYTHTGLTTGTSYYYRLWGINGSCSSPTNSTVMCTTYAGGASIPAPVAPAQPINWTGAVDDTAFEDLPTDAIMIQLSTESGVPKENLYLLIAGLALVTIFFYVFGKSGNVFMATLADFVLITVLAIMGLVPLWVAAIFGIIGLGMNWKGLSADI